MTPSDQAAKGHVSVRQVSLADAALLAEMHRRSFGPGDLWDQASIGATLALPTTRGWLAARNDEPVAFLLMQFLPPDCEILTFCVVPDYQRQKLGTQMLALAVSCARDAGCANIFLDVAQDNAAALALYKQIGFTEIGRREAYYKRANQAAKAALILILPLGSIGK